MGIIGKSKKKSVVDLLGKKKEKLKVSTIGGYYIDGKDENGIHDEMKMYQDLGFKACKFKIGKLEPKADFKRVQAAKKAVSSDFDLMVDVNCGYSVEEASQFCEMAKDINIRWLEEPCHWWDDIYFMSELKKKTKIKIAAGQSEINHYGIRRMVEKKSIDVCNLDSFHAGGITEWKRAAKICNEHDIEMAHHEEASISRHLLGSEVKGTYVEIFADPNRDPFHEKIWINKPKITWSEYEQLKRSLKLIKNMSAVVSEEPSDRTFSVGKKEFKSRLQSFWAADGDMLSLYKYDIVDGRNIQNIDIQNRSRVAICLLYTSDAADE